MKTSRLDVTMNEVQPTVVRVLDVPAGVLLPELLDLLQAAIEWTDSHLHQFVAGDISYAMPDLDGPDDQRDESAVDRWSPGGSRRESSIRRQPSLRGPRLSAACSQRV